jgi:hypothetical protein
MTVCLVVWAASLSSAPDARAQIVASGRTLTVTTTNAVATFSGADLVGFVNRLTGESYLRKPSSGELAAVNVITPTGQGLQSSDWATGIDAGSGQPMATIEVRDSIRVLTLSVRIDPASREIVLRSSASAGAAGVREASWSLAGLDLDGGRWIVPAMSGLVFDKAHPGLNMSLEYPNTWHAQMAVYEAAAGSFVLYSTDPNFHFKQLHHSTRGDSTIDVAIATVPVAPIPSATVVPAVEWRMKAVPGDWRAAAVIYRDWLNANRVPLPNTAHPWVSNIRAVVGIHDLNVGSLAPLAAALVPSQTLLYVVDWRQTSYDVNYPDYTPNANAAAFVTAAKALGFKVMLHVDLIGVSPGNADYAALQAYQVRTPETLQPTGWQWDLPPSIPTRFAYINPASNAFRSLFITRLNTAVAALAPDALHLDISAPMFNDGNGPIDGRTYPQGSARLHEDLVAAFPNIALGGEGENDIVYRYEAFAQAWFFPQTLDIPGHPITTFLFYPQVQFYGHLGQPIATAPGFSAYLTQLERRAVLPRLVLTGPSDLDTTNADNARLIHMLQSWQTHAFQPAWAADWTGAKVKYSGLGAATATYSESPTLSSLTAAGVPLFTLAQGANQVTTGSFIPWWPAFDSTRLYGLDPAGAYFLENVARPTTTHVTSLPDGIKLGPGTIVSAGFAHVEVQRAASQGIDLEQRLIEGHTGIRFQGTDTPLGHGSVAVPTVSTVGGVTRSSIALEPPYQGQIGGAAFVQYDVPVIEGALMQFAAGIGDGASCSDGVTFRVTANGFELWSEHVSPGAWHDVVLSLAAFSGKTIALRLISDPGPAGLPWCDWARWASASIAPPASGATASIPLALAVGSVVSGFDGEGTLSSSGLSATVANVPLPGAFTIFTRAGTAVAAGSNLASISPTVWAAARGGLVRPGSVFNAGSVGTTSAGGVTKNQVVSAHPPDGGRTVLTWAVRLPATALRLGFSVGIGDGAASTDGIDFQVRVNGITYWQLTKQSNQWQSAALELGRWKNQNVLIELVTDSRETFGFDWALWADLQFATSATVCAISAPAGVAMPSFGGTSSVNVTTTAGCPWSATTTAPWLSAGAAGNGSGTLTLFVAPNAGPARSGTLVIAGQNVTVTQSASAIVTNSPPTVSDIINVGTRRNTPVTVSVSVGDLVGGAAGVVVSAASSNVALVPNGNILTAGAGTARTLTLRPAPNRTGAAIIVVTASARGYSVSTTFRLTVHGSGPASDFEADNRAEVGVYRPSNGGWYLLQSSSAFTAGAGYAWGAPGDVPQLGDFDGDGKADITVYRPSSAYWFILKSTSGYTVWDTYQWGTSGDLPMAADYDGDGRADLAVYRPASGSWYILLSTTGFSGGAGYIWGAAGDVPLPADYDGDGRADLAVYRPSSGHWFILQSTTGYTSWGTYQWGSTGDIMAPADYDGDGRADLAVYRPSSGTWYVLTSSSQFSAGAGYVWGAAGDVPVPEDYDGDGQTDIAVYRPSTAHWFVLTSSTGYASSLTYQWGSSGDVPLPRR